MWYSTENRADPSSKKLCPDGRVDGKKFPSVFLNPLHAQAKNVSQCPAVLQDDFLCLERLSGTAQRNFWIVWRYRVAMIISPFCETSTTNPASGPQTTDPVALRVEGVVFGDVCDAILCFAVMFPDHIYKIRFVTLRSPVKSLPLHPMVPAISR